MGVLFSNHLFSVDFSNDDDTSSSDYDGDHIFIVDIDIEVDILKDDSGPSSEIRDGDGDYDCDYGGFFQFVKNVATKLYMLNDTNSLPKIYTITVQRWNGVVNTQYQGVEKKERLLQEQDVLIKDKDIINKNEDVISKNKIGINETKDVINILKM